MADLTLILAGAVGALAAGAFAAQLNGPLSTDWRGKKGALKRRLLALATNAPGPTGRLLGAVILTATLSGGALAAYAASPPASAPERLATQAAGVIGSGDQLSLKLQTPQGERNVKVGEAYEEGWTLQALTPTKATLAKDGTKQEIGLNPTGQIASAEPDATPSTIKVVGLPNDLTIQAYIDRAGPQGAQRLAQAASLGLGPEEARRYLVYMTMAEDEATRRTPPGAAPQMPDPAAMRALLGDEAFDDFTAIRTRGNAVAQAQVLAGGAARAPAGPSPAP